MYPSDEQERGIMNLYEQNFYFGVLFLLPGNKGVRIPESIGRMVVIDNDTNKDPFAKQDSIAYPSVPCGKALDTINTSFTSQ